MAARIITKIVLLLAISVSIAFSQTNKKPNILFIAVDDLRPELGCYGYDEVISPNIDRLADEGVTFTRAYTSVPICMASRSSMLTGYRPNQYNLYNCLSVEENIPDAETINKFFENRGYSIWASGKLYHYSRDSRIQFGKNWENIEKRWYGRGYATEESKKIVDEYASVFEEYKGQPANGRGPAFEAADVEDEGYFDGLRTKMAIEKLKEFAGNNKPFLMMLGYKKPHLPFTAPKKYWEMYDEENIQLADNQFLPENYTEYTKYNFTELRNYYGIPKDDKLLPEDLSKKLKHGYLACVSYIDAQIGKLLTALEELELRENTLIVLWGDHGWKLSEHGMWCKHTPFEIDNRIPFILSLPGKEHKGSRLNGFAESVDIYPTLAAAAGFEIPERLQGNNLLPLIEDPSINWKPAAFMEWPKRNRTNPEKAITAYMLRTDKYRYVEWTRKKTNEVLARELYDQDADPNENKNIANLKENEELVDSLSKMLIHGEGWRKFHQQMD